MCKGVILNFWCPCTWSGHNLETTFGPYGHRIVRQLNMGAYEWCSEYFLSDKFQLGQFIPNCPKIDHGFSHSRSTSLCNECQQNGCAFEYAPRSTYGYPSLEERRRYKPPRYMKAKTQSLRKRAPSEPDPELRRVDVCEVPWEPPTPTGSTAPANRNGTDPAKCMKDVRHRENMDSSHYVGKLVLGGNARMLDAPTETSDTETAADVPLEVADQFREQYTYSIFGGRPGGGRRRGRARSNATAAFVPSPLHQANIQNVEDDDDVCANFFGLAAKVQRREQDAMDEEWAELVKSLNVRERPSFRASDRSEASTPSAVIGSAR